MMGSSSVFSSLGAAFHALPPLSFHSRSLSSTIYPTTYTHPLVDAFQSWLNSELRRLQESGASYLSAEWLGQALELCLDVHSRAEELFPHIQQAILRENRKWVDEQLDATVKLLDVCNALRQTISDVKEYQALLQMIVRGLEGFSDNPICARHLFRAGTALGNCKEFMVKREAQSLHASSQKRSRLDKCSSMLRQIGEKLLATPTSGNSSKAQFLEILYGSTATTVFVCGVLVAALSFKSKRCLPAAPHMGHYSSASALHGLHHKVKEEIDRRRSKGARAPLHELDSVDTAVRHLHDVVNKWTTRKSPSSDLANEALELKQSVESLKKCVADMEAGIGPFEKQMDKLFRLLIGNRMALLDSISYS